VRLVLQAQEAEGLQVLLQHAAWVHELVVPAWAADMMEFVVLLVWDNPVLLVRAGASSGRVIVAVVMVVVDRGDSYAQRWLVQAA